MGKIDTNNTDPKYWERQLKKYGLGGYSSGVGGGGGMTDNSDGEMADTRSSASEQFAQLRIRIDGNDNFMGGHQIMKVQTKERVIPEWAFSNKEVSRILKTAFPKMDAGGRIGKSQRTRAGKWAQLIHLYYRMGLPYQIVTKEMGMDYVLMRRWVQKINFVAKGLTIDGKPRRRHTSNAPVRDPGERNEHIESALLPTAGTGGTRKGGTTS